MTEISTVDTETDPRAAAGHSPARIWLLGLPFDVVTLAQATELIRKAAMTGEQVRLATPNVNFAAMAAKDVQFRRAVFDCNLFLADGMPVVWLSGLAGPALPERVSGSSLFEELARHEGTRPLRVFFFGGASSVAEQAARNVGRLGKGLEAAGWMSPGFGSLDELGSDAVIATINDSNADLLLVAIGARRGHLWIAQNRHRLRVPVVAYLGATINFAAGSVRRAPRWLQRSGLEWAWRIGQEPQLASRYLADGTWLGADALRTLAAALQRLLHGAGRSDSLQFNRNGDGSWTATGALTARTLERWKELVRTHLHPGTTLDVGGISRADSAGLGALYNLLVRPEPQRPRWVAKRIPCAPVARLLRELAEAGYAGTGAAAGVPHSSKTQ